MFRMQGMCGMYGIYGWCLWYAWYGTGDSVLCTQKTIVLHLSPKTSKISNAKKKNSLPISLRNWHMLIGIPIKGQLESLHNQSSDPTPVLHHHPPSSLACTSQAPSIDQVFGLGLGFFRKFQQIPRSDRVVSSQHNAIVKRNSQQKKLGCSRVVDLALSRQTLVSSIFRSGLVPSAAALFRKMYRGQICNLVFFSRKKNAPRFGFF